MGKRKAHPFGRPKATPAPESSKEETGTLYFYLPQEKPYGAFCQWHTSPFSIPTTSLQWLVDMAPSPPPAPASPPTSKPTTEDTPTPQSAHSILTAHKPCMHFTSAEQSYMYAKALFFTCPQSCTRILSTPDPKTQKKLGQRIKTFNPHHWNLVKSRVARVGNWYKFTAPQNAHLREILLGTGERELVEAGRRDRVWGIGFRADEAEGFMRVWGENLLGRCLVDVRGRVREWERRVKEGEVVDWDWDGWLEDEGEKVEGDEKVGGEEEEDA